MMTIDKALKRMEAINKQIALHCENIKGNAKHLPDENAIGRIGNELAAIDRLKIMFDGYSAIVASNGE